MVLLTQADVEVNHQRLSVILKMTESKENIFDAVPKPKSELIHSFIHEMRLLTCRSLELNVIQMRNKRKYCSANVLSQERSLWKQYKSPQI